MPTGIYKHKPRSEETKQRISIAKKGKKLGFIPKYAFKKGNISWNKGIKGLHLSPETEFKKDNKAHLGFKHSEEVRIKMQGMRKEVMHKGYRFILMPNHPNSTKGGYIFEHRLIMEKHLGRYLKQKEVIHHINRIKTDNRIENLILLPNNKEHLKLHNNIHKILKEVKGGEK